jgi:hypothetical protein
MIKRNCLLLLIIALLTACVSNKSTLLIDSEYDDKRNETNYQVFPYGSVIIPGEWYRTNYNNTSRQQFFDNSDGITIAIAFSPCDKYEFNEDGEKKSFDFVTAYYEWDAGHLVSGRQMNQELIESNEADNYIIWRLFGQYNDTPVDNYYLFGEYDGFAKNFCIMATDKWSRGDKIAFLKTMYLGKK